MKKIVLFLVMIFLSYNLSFANEIEPTCKRYFDWCNNCARWIYGWEMACTMMACEKNQEPKCLEYFSTWSNVWMANPASVYCEKNWWTLSINKDSDGWEKWICSFSNWNSCEEWAFFRWECLNVKACTKEYNPVCAQPPMPVCPEWMMCIQVMPQPKTYWNKCMALNENAKIISEWSCDSSNSWVIEWSEPKACTREYNPVCGYKTVQCIKAPCYPIYETYSNTCLANNDNSEIIHNWKCISPLLQNKIQNNLTKIMEKIPSEKIEKSVELVSQKIDLIILKDNISEFKKSIYKYLKSLLQAY